MKKVADLTNIIFFSIILVLYLILWKVSTLTGVSLQGIPGILLFFFLPGFYITKIIPALNLNFGKLGTIALQIIYTFTIISVLGYVVQTIFGFNSEAQTIAVLTTNFILYLLSIFLPNWKKWSGTKLFGFNNKKIHYEIHKYDYYIIGAAALLTLIPLLISPIAQNADNYLTLIRNSIIVNENILTSRQLFSSYIALANKVLSVDLKFIFRNIFILLYFASTLFLYEYLKSKSKNNYIIALGYLALFIPAVLITEVNIIRPQVIMLIFTLPVLVLSMSSIEDNDILPAIIATVLAIVSIKYHELGVLLLLIALLSLSASVYRLVFLQKIINWKHIITTLLLIYAYGRLFSLGEIFKTAILFAEKSFSTNNTLTWRWWFLANYKSIDGINISWQGVQAANYYLYNGLPLLLIIIFFGILALKNRQRIKPALLLPLTYLLIFMFFAEIMPRMGLYFLPNRAWVHLSFAAVLILAFQLIQFEKSIKLVKYWKIPVLLLIIMGFCGSIYVAKNNVEDVFKEELRIAIFIKKNLPRNAVILSSQKNESLVSIYAERDYGQLNIENRIDNQSQFTTITDSKLGELSIEQKIVTRPLIRQITENVINGTATITSINTLQEETIEKRTATYHGSEPVYFLYSYRKLNGLNGSREYNQKYIDKINENIYKNLGYTIIYSDKNSLLIKIK